MNHLTQHAIALLKREEARGDIKVNIDHDTSEIFVSSLYADYFITATNRGYKLTYYRYKWDDEADQMESWPYDEGARLSDNFVELAELIIDDVRN